MRERVVAAARYYDDVDVMSSHTPRAIAGAAVHMRLRYGYRSRYFVVVPDVNSVERCLFCMRRRSEAT